MSNSDFNLKSSSSSSSSIIIPVSASNGFSIIDAEETQSQVTTDSTSTRPAVNLTVLSPDSSTLASSSSVAATFSSNMIGQGTNFPFIPFNSSSSVIPSLSAKTGDDRKFPNVPPHSSVYSSLPLNAPPSLVPVPSDSTPASLDDLAGVVVPPVNYRAFWIEPTGVEYEGRMLIIPVGDTKYDGMLRAPTVHLIASGVTKAETIRRGQEAVAYFRQHDPALIYGRAAVSFGTSEYSGPVTLQNINPQAYGQRTLAPASSSSVSSSNSLFPVPLPSVPRSNSFAWPVETVPRSQNEVKFSVEPSSSQPFIPSSSSMLSSSSESLDFEEMRHAHLNLDAIPTQASPISAYIQALRLNQTQEDSYAFRLAGFQEVGSTPFTSSGPRRGPTLPRDPLLESIYGILPSLPPDKRKSFLNSLSEEKRAELAFLPLIKQHPEILERLPSANPSSTAQLLTRNDVGVPRLSIPLPFETPASSSSAHREPASILKLMTSVNADEPLATDAELKQMYSAARLEEQTAKMIAKFGKLDTTRPREAPPLEKAPDFWMNVFHLNPLMSQQRMLALAQANFSGDLAPLVYNARYMSELILFHLQALIQLHGGIKKISRAQMVLVHGEVNFLTILASGRTCCSNLTASQWVEANGLLREAVKVDHEQEEAAARGDYGAVRPGSQPCRALLVLLDRMMSTQLNEYNLKQLKSVFVSALQHLAPNLAFPIFTQIKDAQSWPQIASLMVTMTSSLETDHVWFPVPRLAQDQVITLSEATGHAIITRLTHFTSAVEAESSSMEQSNELSSTL